MLYSDVKTRAKSLLYTGAGRSFEWQVKGSASFQTRYAIGIFNGGTQRDRDRLLGLFFSSSAALGALLTKSWVIGAPFRSELLLFARAQWTPCFMACIYLRALSPFSVASYLDAQ